jgi:hypothetical protein
MKGTFRMRKQFWFDDFIKTFSYRCLSNRCVAGQSIAASGWVCSLEAVLRTGVAGQSLAASGWVCSLEDFMRGSDRDFFFMIQNVTNERIQFLLCFFGNPFLVVDTEVVCSNIYGNFVKLRAFPNQHRKFEMKSLPVKGYLL